MMSSLLLNHFIFYGYHIPSPCSNVDISTFQNNAQTILGSMGQLTQMISCGLEALHNFECTIFIHSWMGSPRAQMVAIYMTIRLDMVSNNHTLVCTSYKYSPYQCHSSNREIIAIVNQFMIGWITEHCLSMLVNVTPTLTQEFTTLTCPLGRMR